MRRTTRVKKRRAPHDLRGQYAALPTSAELAAVVIDDPYGAPAGSSATSEPRPGAAGGEREWHPPPRPQLLVVRSFRHDPLGRMHARHQITDAEYAAGRAYQMLVETARSMAHAAAPATWGMGGRSSSGAPSDGPVTDEMLRAGRRLRATDARIRARYGVEGLEVMRAVLVEHRRLDQIQPGAENQGLRFWGFLLRRCLDEVAVLLGLARRPR